MSDFIDKVINVAKIFIPNDISEKIGERMADEKRKYDFSDEVAAVIKEISTVPGITPASSRDMKDATPIFKLKDGSVVSRYVNPARFEHIFISDRNGNFIYGGYVGWIHNDGLLQKEKELAEKYG